MSKCCFVIIRELQPSCALWSCDGPRDLLCGHRKQGKASNRWGQFFPGTRLFCCRKVWKYRCSVISKTEFGTQLHSAPHSYVLRCLRLPRTNNSARGQLLRIALLCYVLILCLIGIVEIKIAVWSHPKLTLLFVVVIFNYMHVCGYVYMSEDASGDQRH